MYVGDKVRAPVRGVVQRIAGDWIDLLCADGTVATIHADFLRAESDPVAPAPHATHAARVPVRPRGVHLSDREVAMLALAASPYSRASDASAWAWAASYADADARRAPRAPCAPLGAAGRADPILFQPTLASRYCRDFAAYSEREAARAGVFGETRGDVAPTLRGRARIAAATR